ncbi:uncharacterized protein [Drosophila tropicalis]|uniref:uncharacterized protein n=1 Tax=Drosophila tropicalis TaxID=46794 RepID=UPI0035AB9F26
MNNTTQPPTTCGAPSRRIINKIPLDFNKLRCAGLDRILAEELSKQNTKGKTLNSIAASTTNRDQELYLPKSLTTSAQDPQQQQQMIYVKDSDDQPIGIQEYCRICMDKSTQLTNIMSEPDHNHELSLFEMLNDVMDEAYRIERDGEDSMPQQICNNCVAATRNAYALRRKYEESYRYFRQQLTKMRQVREVGAAAKRTESEFLINIKEEPPSEPDYITSDEEETYDVSIKEEPRHHSDQTNIKELSHLEMASSTKGFNLRLLLIRKREQLDNEENLYEVDRSNKGPLQCGLCFSRCGLTNWHTHLGEHYGVGWLHGQKPPSLTRGGIIAQMSGYLKEDRDNRLTCRLCNRQFGSGLGMMQHLEGCGEELQRFQCTHCGRYYTKLSLIAHQRGCMKKFVDQATDKDKPSKRKPKLTSKISWITDDSSKKRKTIDRSPFNLRLLLIRKREQLTTTEEVREEDHGTGPLQCGLCLARCGKSTWKMHIAEHYGVGWLKNDDKPQTITRSGVIGMMQTYLKENQGSRLICRLCNREFASGLGMLLHLEGCGEKQQRFKCKYCSRSYTRLSLITHLRSCSHQYEYQISSSSANVELKTERKSRPKSNVDQSQIKKSSVKAPFNLRLLLIRKREDLDSQVVIPQQDKKDGQLECGVCSERIIKGDWRNHLGTHYGVGWLRGQEPRNITRHSIIGQMNSYLKKNPGKRLTCRLCNRQLSSGLGMLLHLEGCGMKKHRIKCKYCPRSFTRLSLLQHIRMCEKQFEKDLQLDMETQTDIDDSGVEGEGSVELSKFKRKRSKAIQNCSKWTKSLYTRYQLLNDKVACKWTQFTQASYAKEPLYADCLPSYVKLSWTEAHELFNSSRQTKSMRFAYDKVKDECDWRELTPLEAIHTKNEYITYLGAPVKQLEWVPLPPNVNEQYLLCSLRSKMHGYTRKIDANAKDKALMVLLKCTLDTETRATDEWPLQTKLHYGLRVQKGPVFSFAFMPSGGYMESSNRLGLFSYCHSIE